MDHPTSMNRCNLPPWAIASKHYNRYAEVRLVPAKQKK